MKTIIELHHMGGPLFMTLLSMLAVAILILAIVSAIQLYGNFRNRPVVLKNMILGILYLGSFSFVLGFLGQGLGIYQALRAIEIAGDVSPALIMGGIKVSMITPFYGTFILLISSILWFVLKTRYNRVYGRVIETA